MIKSIRAFPKGIQIQQRLSLQRVMFLSIVSISLAVVTMIVAIPFLTGRSILTGLLLQLEANGVAPKPSEMAYLISWQSGCDLKSGSCNREETGRLRTINLETGQVLKTLETGYAPDIAVSPDGQRVYLAAIRGAGGPTEWEDNLTAFDTASWEPIWKSVIEHPPGTNGRVYYMGGEGPSGLLLSPDATKLFIYKNAGHTSWLEVRDSATGKIIGESDRLEWCDTAELSFSLDGQWIYFICYGSNDIRFMDATTLKVQENLSVPGATFDNSPDAPPYTRFGGIPGAMAASALSSDGRLLYVVTDNARVAIIDLKKRQIERWVDLARQASQAVKSAALSSVDNQLLIGLGEEGGAGASAILNLDTQSWKTMSRLQPSLNGQISQLIERRGKNQLLILQNSNHAHGMFLHVHSSVSILDLARPSFALPLKVDLAEDEQIVRISDVP